MEEDLKFEGSREVLKSSLHRVGRMLFKGQKLGVGMCCQQDVIIGDTIPCCHTKTNR